MGRGFPVLLVVLMLGLGPVAHMGGSVGGGDDRGPGPLDDSSVWTDSFDDLSHVYVPAGGLSGVEVTGGQAQLEAGEDNGWIASSVISARPGMKYDYVFIDADTPGASSINISIVNASAESIELGFANKTIDGFKLAGGPYLSLLSLDWRIYPDIRIQVNLVAGGADRPVLYAWDLYYLDVEAWQDNFLWPGRMADHKGLNFTDGNLEVNLTSFGGSGGGGDYDEYPPIVCSGGSGGPDVYYVNAQGTGYQDRTTIGIGGWSNGLTIDDLNGDGYFDLVVQMWVGRVRILWGDATGTWSMTGATTLDHPSSPQEPATGDFNGDGEVDIAVACNSGSGDFSYVYLNEGGGSFTDLADVTMSVDSTDVSTGDLDGDGYDDILFSDGDNARVYMGDADGPDNTPSITFSTVNCRDTHIEDVDGDGHLDVVLGELNGGKTRVFLGDRDGPDTTADYSLSVPDSVRACDAADVNGDGYTDLLFYSGSGSTYRLYIFEGSSQGWSDSRRHSDITHDDDGEALGTADLDKDGFEDIMQVQAIGGNNYRFKVWFGDTSWPSTPDIVKEGGYDYGVVAAVPRDSTGVRAYRGTFTTERISLPTDRYVKWDVLDLGGSMPNNTTMTLSVLDGLTGDPVTGYEELTDWSVDLAGINPDSHGSIMVEVTLTSEFNHTTPVLEHIMVKWVDRRVWRDEFYGDAKADRLLGLEVVGDVLRATAPGGPGPQLIFPSIMGDDNYTTTPRAFLDAGGGDYLSTAPIELGATGTSAVDVADVNGDGHMDVALAVHRIARHTFQASSPLYIGSPLGLRQPSAHAFDTTGAMDVLLRDLDHDGYVDVVFAQEQKAEDDYDVASILFWGSDEGWPDTPDVEFATSGASDVEAVDLNGDGLLDLVFACYWGASASTDSMVFLQNATGFNGTSPSHSLATRGARAVAAGDLDGDALVDLVFANSFSAGSAEVDSYVYWGKAGGGFDDTPAGLPTMGATDVKVADLDGDTDLDVVFANYWDNSQDREVGSAVYLNDGSGGFGTAPDFSLPTTGATGVAVADLDGTGWKDLLFSCERDADTYKVPSLVYLGGASGWSTAPDIEVPTEGASDVTVARLLEHGSGGYLSVPIVLDYPARDTGTVHTLRCSASVGASVTGTVRLVDKETWEVLVEVPLRAGSNEWDVRDLFRVTEHPAVRVMVVLAGLRSQGEFTLDDHWLNWTQRAWVPPGVLDLGLSEAAVFRLGTVGVWVNVTDTYDTPGDLTVQLEHRINGTDMWETYLVGSLTFDRASGAWRTFITPKVTAPAGVHDFRVNVMDLDGQYSGWREFPQVLEVLNNLPTTPEVTIEPERPVSTSTLRVDILRPSTDVESSGIMYHYRWFKDGEWMEDLTTDSVPFSQTSRGQNWSVEVRGFDGEDEGAPAFAWRLIGNAAPIIKNYLSDPVFNEDTVDSDWIDLSEAFEDPDGDVLTWSVETLPDHLDVSIDPATGRVTLTPEPDWFGEVNVTFVASDGTGRATQLVTVTVMPVNDIPWIATVDGSPPSSDPMVYTVNLGEVLTITYTVGDVEGHEVLASINTTALELDEGAGTLTFDPGTEVIGKFHFALKIWDVVTPERRVLLNFTIEVVNENDPMGEPRITLPLAGESFEVNQSFSLVAECDDPDIPFGQVLNFTWTSNISGPLGHEASLTLWLDVPGTHRITVTVTDGEFTKSATIDIVIEPEDVVEPPEEPDDDGDDDEGGLNYLLIVAIMAVLVIVGVVIFVATSKRRTEAYEDEMDAEMVEEAKREALQRTAAAIKDVADGWEAEREGTEAVKAAAREEGWELEEIAVESTAAPLTMEARVTEAASDEVQRLWVGISEPATGTSEEDKEALRLENLKRRYQNTIGRLPYGIPSKELADRDWVDLANALATGEKKVLPDGREVTAIDGRWYHSDTDDSSTFLKEHGAKPEAATKADDAHVDRDDLLAKLEERFILGEISEENYKELKKKYSG